MPGADFSATIVVAQAAADGLPWRRVSTLLEKGAPSHGAVSFHIQPQGVAMLLPQNEAKFKHCPLLTTKDDKLRFCLGAACMMWRYANPEKRGDSDQGYCGVAGRPVGAL